VKKIFKFVFILFGIFIAISVVSGIYQGVTGKDLSPKNYSYEIGYMTGTSEQLGRTRISLNESNAEELCMFLLDLSLNSSPNDGIDWASINSDDYIQGCLVGARETYPDADWVN